MKTIKIKEDYTAVVVDGELICIIHTTPDGWPELMAYEDGELKYISSI